VAASRADFVCKFLGETTEKTTALLQKALGGVLLVDEAYALGTVGKNDVVSSEAINVFNDFIEKHSDDLVVLIAGYEDKIEQVLFASNPGLKSRFPVTLQLPEYTSEQLGKIFAAKIQESGWKLDDSKSIFATIRKHSAKFSGQGRDMQSLTMFAIAEASNRVWRSAGKDPPVVNATDVKAAVKAFRPKANIPECVPIMFT
jgi:hypothetical protein